MIGARQRAGALLVAAALGLAACGGGDDGGGGTTSTPAGGSGDTASAGKAVFTSNCSGCHTLADAGSDGKTGPNLDDLGPSKALVVRQVTNGGGGMPAFGDTLSDDEIQSVATYVSSVAGK